MTIKFKNLLIFSTLAVSFLSSCGQSNNSQANKSENDILIDSLKKLQKYLMK